MRWDKAVRIGVNWGSLDQELLAELMDANSRRTQPWDARQVMYEALITSAIESAKRAEEMGLSGDQIILSCKVSGVQDLISVYRELARRCDYALHLGLTEAGMGIKGISLPGTGEAPAAPVFIDGEKAMTLRGEGIAREFQDIVEGYIARRFGNGAGAQ